MKKTIFILSALFLLPLAGGGCSSRASSASVPTDGFSEPASLVTADEGGYTAADEAPGFGLESMGQYEADQKVADPSVTPEEEAKQESDPDAQVYLVRIVWGNLELNARDELAGGEGGDIIPWDGSLSYDGNAVLLLKRTILFEENDTILEEGDPTAISWTSTTGPHVDGILAKLIVHPGQASDVLTFETTALTQEIPLADLDHYNEIVTLDEEGHGAAFTALRVNDDDCPEGFLEGKWHPRRAEEGGIFRGRVLSDEGELNGHIRGHYGEDADNNQVFFGKYIHTDGLFRGFLRGTFGDGAFAGNWHAAGGAVEGTLNGKYVTGADVDSGFFQGFWEETCH